MRPMDQETHCIHGYPTLAMVRDAIAKAKESDMTIQYTRAKRENTNLLIARSGC